MSVADWCEEVLGQDEPVDQLRRIVPVLEALRPRWEHLWESFWPEPEEVAKAIATGREGLSQLKRFLSNDGASELSRLARESDAWANVVGENGQQLDGYEDAGAAHAFTALLTISLFVAAGEEHEGHTLEEIIEGMNDLVDAYPELEDVFL